MEVKPSKEHLIEVLNSQLSSMVLLTTDEIKEEIEEALEVMSESFKYFYNKYFQDKDGNAIFSSTHCTQYMLFLYRLSRILSKKNKKLYADKVYQLNRALSSCDLFHEVDLPINTYCDHPVGTVIGRGNFGEYFYFAHGCTVGNNQDKFPVGDGYLVMFAHSQLIGNCKIGSHVIISNGAYVKDEDISPYSIVFGRSPNLTIKTITEEKFFEIAPFVHKSKPAYTYS